MNIVRASGQIIFEAEEGTLSVDAGCVSLTFNEVNSAQFVSIKSESLNIKTSIHHNDIHSLSEKLGIPLIIHEVPWKSDIPKQK